MVSRRGAISQRDVRALREVMEGDDPPRLIDVRTAGEFSRGHVPGAVNIPLSNIERRIDELDGERPVWLICRSGNRSHIAATALAARGVEAINVAGGTLAWRRAGLPVVQPPGGALPLPLLPPLVASLTLGLAPFLPEPHVVGKLRWIAGGAVGMAPMDWLDLLMHGAPWVWLGWALLQRLDRRRG